MGLAPHRPALAELEHVYVWSGTSPRRSFRDAKIQRLENMSADIAVGLAVLAAAKTAERLRREEEQRRAEERRRLRELALRARHVEERRRSALEGILGKVEEAGRLRQLLSALREGGDGEPGSRVAEFTRWAQAWLAEQEAALSGRALERRFAEQRLFGEDDDHGFRPPGW